MSYIGTYQWHFDSFFGQMDYSKAARAFKAYIIFVIDKGAFEEHKEPIMERMAALEAAQPLMDFDQLCIAENVCRYARKRLRELEPAKYAAGLSRDATPEELKRQSELATAYGNPLGNDAPGSKPMDGFLDDLRSNSDDDE